MTSDELLGSLRAIELRLSTSEVNSFFREQDEVTRQQFVHLSLQISIAVSRVTTAQFNEIADNLDRLTPELNAGITSLQSSILQLNDAIAIVTTLTQVLDLVGKVLTVV